MGSDSPNSARADVRPLQWGVCRAFPPFSRIIAELCARVAMETPDQSYISDIRSATTCLSNDVIWKKNASFVANILDIFSKSTSFYSSSIPPSNVPNSGYLAPLFAESFYLDMLFIFA